MRRSPDEVEARPTPSQQMAGLSLFAPLEIPVNTRRAARESIQERADTLRDKVLKALERGSLTADEIATAIGESVLGVRPRVAELHLAGAIHDSGTRRHNASGRMAVVWALKQGRTHGA